MKQLLETETHVSPADEYLALTLNKTFLDVLSRNYAITELDLFRASPGLPFSIYPDPAALHGGCPVEEGTKYIVTRWVRSAEFRVLSSHSGRPHN